MFRILCVLFSTITSFCFAGGDTLNLITKTEHKTKHLTVIYQVDKLTDRKNGTYTQTYDGDVLTQGNYKDGKRVGHWVHNYSKDSPQSVGNYVRGKKDGEWISYYRNGNVSSKIIYVNGGPGDTFTSYYEDKTIKTESVPGLVTHYYSNGKISEEIHMKDGKQNGPAKRYYESGTLKETRTMKDGRRDSIYLFYYENGTLWEHILYRHGGIWNVLAYNSSNGKPIDCCTIKDGQGTMRFYDQDGKVSEESEYKNTMLNGPCKRYGKTGIKSAGSYADDNKTGVWKYYDDEGKLKMERRYVDGLEDGAELDYDSDGSLSSTGMNRKGLSEGEWKSFDRDGKTNFIRNYVHDTLEGQAQYFKNGKMTEEGLFMHGERAGIWISYDKEGKETSRKDYGTPTISISEEGKPYVKTENEKVYSFTERMPEFPGGNETALMKYLATNIHYPKQAIQNGIQGTVYISFIVSDVGEVIDIKIARGVNEELDREALRVVSEMPRWEAGAMNDEPVSVSFSVPIKFRLK